MCTPKNKNAAVKCHAEAECDIMAAECDNTAAECDKIAAECDNMAAECEAECDTSWHQTTETTLVRDRRAAAPDSVSG